MGGFKHLGLGCLLHLGFTLAFDYTFEAPQDSQELQEFQSFQKSDEQLASSTPESEFSNRQGYYQLNPYARQDGLATSIPLLVALGIGGIVAGAAVVQNANQARNNLQSQLDTINARITTSSNSVSSLTASLSTLSTTANANAVRASTACAAIASGGALATPVVALATDADVKAFIESLIQQISATPCPP